jgi:hypothetical protein
MRCTELQDIIDGCPGNIKACIGKNHGAVKRFSIEAVSRGNI